MTLDDFIDFFTNQSCSVGINYWESSYEFEINIYSAAESEEMYFKKLGAHGRDMRSESLEYVIKKWKEQVFGSVENYNKHYFKDKK